MVRSFWKALLIFVSVKIFFSIEETSSMMTWMKKVLNESFAKLEFNGISFVCLDDVSARSGIFVNKPQNLHGKKMFDKTQIKIKMIDKMLLF